MYATWRCRRNLVVRVVTEMPGRVVIRGLRCRGRQGPNPVDQERTHDYLVDVALSVDIGSAVSRDELSAALDIAAVASVIRDEVARGTRTLLERMAADVARALLQRFDQVTDVSVTVQKPEPAGLDAASEAVELTLSR